MAEQSDTMKGTTTVGIVFETGVVLASEKRATMGYLISNKTAKKIYQVAPRIGLTTAGGVGDAQQLARLMTVEANLYEIRRGKRISVQAASTLLSNILHGNRMFPFYVQLLIGGVDENGPVIFSVDAVGGKVRKTALSQPGPVLPWLMVCWKTGTPLVWTSVQPLSLLYALCVLLSNGMQGPERESLL